MAVDGGNIATYTVNAEWSSLAAGKRGYVLVQSGKIHRGDHPFSAALHGSFVLRDACRR